MYFFVENLQRGNILGAAAEHWWAMRPVAGEECLLTDLRGQVLRVQVTQVEKRTRSISWQVLSMQQVQQAATNTLIQAKTDRVYLEKLVEILPHAGVSVLYIIDTELSEKMQPVNHERLERILVRACEQAQVAYLPRIEVVAGAAQGKLLVQELAPTVLDIVAVESQIIPQKDDENKAQNRAVFVGPEGGWSAAEKTWFDEQGLRKCSLGTVVFPAWLAGFAYFARL